MTTRSCDQDHAELSAWIDGDLEPGAQERVTGHLEGCAACRQVVDDLRALQRAAAALGDHDTRGAEGAAGWQGIVARLPQPAHAQERPSGRRGLLVAAAAVVLLTIAAVGWFTTREGAVDGTERRARLELARLRTQQERTIAALLAVVRRDRQRWAPELQQTYHKNLALVDAAINECRRALERKPRSLPLRASLMAAYGRKVDLLQLFAEQNDQHDQHEEERP